MQSSVTFEELVEQTSLQQAERLAYIDFKIRYLGSVSRGEIIEEFKIGQAAASGDLKLYKKFREDNAYRDNATKKTVIKTESYSPLVKLDVHTALNFIHHGFCRNELMEIKSMLPLAVIDPRMSPDTLNEDDVAAVTRAITSKSGLSCGYYSASSGDHHDRLLFPTALFVDRKYWYFRAYDRSPNAEKAGFKNFKLARLKDAWWCPEEKPFLDEDFYHDSAWHTLLPLQLVVHEDRKEAGKSLEREFGLTDGRVTLTCQAALAYFVRRNWRIDVGNDEKGYFNFRLENSDGLRQVGSAAELFK
ncbi:WYL domain-containing protein [Serratia marcescens]|uniref:WYL domain-containing protein n=1 Tax=Serratia marcescens TaxID=615 RepID=UPI0034D5843B